MRMVLYEVQDGTLSQMQLRRAAKRWLSEQFVNPTSRFYRKHNSDGR